MDNTENTPLLKSSAFYLVLFAALLLRLSLFWGINRNSPDGFRQSDSEVYIAIANNIVENGSFSDSRTPPYEPNSNRTPTYPFFLSLLKVLGLGVRGVILAQILISLGIAAAVMLFLKRFFGLSRFAAAAAGMIVALDVPSIALANCVLTEILFTAIIVAGAFLFASHMRDQNKTALILSAVMFALASLCRPSAYLLPFFVAAALLCRINPVNRKNFYSAVLFIAVYMLSISPWLIRNNAIFGGPFLSTISYDYLYYDSAAGIVSVRDRISLDDAKSALEKAFTAKYADEMRTAGKLNVKKLQAEEAYKIILSHPAIFAVNVARSMANMLFRPLRNDIDIMLGFTKDHSTLELWGTNDGVTGLWNRMKANTSSFTMILCGLQMLMLAAVYLLSLGGIFGSFSRKRNRPPEDKVDRATVCLLLSVILYFSLMSNGPESYARFRVPLMPFFAILSAIGIESLLASYGKKRQV